MSLNTKSNCLFLFLLLCYGNIFAQLRKPFLNDSLFSTYYHQRLTHFKALPSGKDDIVFLGNSITDGAEWSELFCNTNIKNRGISGDVSAGIINRIDEVTDRKPAKVFLLIGTNDLARGVGEDSLLKNTWWITDYIKQESPSTQVFVQSILPVNDAFGKFAGHTANGEKIRSVNKKLKESADKHGFHFLDLYTAFADASGKLNSKLTNDGLHLKGEGYLLWKHLVFPYLFDLQPKASLIPLPQTLTWKESYFSLYNCRSLVVRDNALSKEALLLQQKLQEKGATLTIANKAPGAPFIELKLGNVEAPQFKEEAYRLEAGNQKVLLTANTAHGIFNGIQTLLQLTRDGVLIDNCEIIDWPSFSWRGYMVDAARNYQSMELLKQQVDRMSHYKLNIFHLHLTEDIAWRLAIKNYPGLTAADNMLRNKGQYYSQEDLQELIAYCKERYITLIPEIDMPGHSTAFTRAFKTSMQTDSGLNIVKNILKEFCQTYDVPYLHIGADEVKITNKSFVPQVTSYIESFGKKVIGWEPGGNFKTSTIRQLWMDDGGKIANDKTIKYLDSRHLYINHMDPLESVVTIFNRRIADKEKGDNQALGGVLCVWPDRRVEREEDVLRMNAVYPAMLSFAERSWRGGGKKGWVANIGSPGSKDANEFAAFEKRLLDHKTSYFEQTPFPYVKQSATVWNLYGPYDNGGDLSLSFEPEQKSFDNDEGEALKIVGGTIVLRHWWYPLISGAIENPKENTTWYASTKIWSDKNKLQNFWIGFNNLSRSPATDSPDLGTWNNLKSVIWLNGELINPPHWQHAGQKGHSEIPLIDEGYEYRKPAVIPLKKGWNTVLVKLPVGSFKGTDWQNPVKWMFTFVETDDDVK